jgi:hypothetical protein
MSTISHSLARARSSLSTIVTNGSTGGKKSVL